MTGWTLAQLKARGLQLEGCCQTEGCGYFYRFDLEALIARAGADYAVPEFIPDMDCLQCGGRLKVYLAAIAPGQENEPQA